MRGRSLMGRIPTPFKSSGARKQRARRRRGTGEPTTQRFTQRAIDDGVRGFRCGMRRRTTPSASGCDHHWWHREHRVPEGRLRAAIGVSRPCGISGRREDPVPRDQSRGYCRTVPPGRTALQGWRVRRVDPRRDARRCEAGEFAASIHGTHGVARLASSPRRSTGRTALQGWRVRRVDPQLWLQCPCENTLTP